MSTTDPRERAMNLATMSGKHSLRGDAGKIAAQQSTTLALVAISDAITELALAVRDGFVDHELDELDQPPASDQQFVDPTGGSGVGIGGARTEGGAAFPPEAVILAAQHIDARLDAGEPLVDNPDLSAIRTVLRYVSDQHNASA